MNPNTGDIKTFKTIEEAKAAGYTVELNEEQTKEMLKLSEQSRIDFIKRKQALKSAKKIRKIDRQKLKAPRKDERNRRKQNRH